MKGDGVLNAIDVGGARYTFAKTVTLESKDECKKGGWATSTDPAFRNQASRQLVRVHAEQVARKHA